MKAPFSREKLNKAENNVVFLFCKWTAWHILCHHLPSGLVVSNCREQSRLASSLHGIQLCNTEVNLWLHEQYAVAEIYLRIYVSCTYSTLCVTTNCLHLQRKCPTLRWQRQAAAGRSFKGGSSKVWTKKQWYFNFAFTVSAQQG